MEQRDQSDTNERLNDPAFIRALKAGDRRAFTMLVRLYQDRVHNVCFRLLGMEEEARDVAQEVFVTIYRKVNSFKEHARLTTWIYRIATNHALNRMKYLNRRRFKQTRTLEIQDLERMSNVAVFPRPDQVLDATRLEAYLQEELDKLDPYQRTVVVLRDMEGLTYEDIAQITGLNAGTLKSRLHRGRARLKEALGRWLDAQPTTWSRASLREEKS